MYGYLILQKNKSDNPPLQQRIGDEIIKSKDCFIKTVYNQYFGQSVRRFPSGQG